MKNTTNQEIVNAFLSGTECIDNHDKSTTELEAVVELQNGRLAAFVPDARYQSLNELYLGSDGLLHLSTESIAGTVDNHEFEKYNLTVIPKSMKISKVIFRDHEEVFA